jgi:hypothetical protein
MNTILLSKTWRQFFTEVLHSPQSYIFWLVIFLIVLFILSRFRNRMEEQGVNKAIYISRGLVGTFIAFIVTPIAFYILLNIVALVHGVEIIDVSFLTQWIGLTITSYWWLLKCFFGSVSVSFAKEIYSVDSFIRILWILLPVSFIWLRMTKSKIGKLFLIPLIIGVLIITRYKTAPPTFITEDRELINKIPVLNWFSTDKETASKEQETNITSEKRKLLAGGLALLIIVGFVVGLYFKFRIAGLFITLVGLLGFVLMAPHELEVMETKHPDYHLDLDSLIFRMDSLYISTGESIDVYEISRKIESAFEAHIDAGDMISFPDSLCRKYESYFYDRCQDRN